tara:strand:+ start:327 stop:458 length:132 start_codon:yes stop_codon:yes gene_type:complete
VPLKDLAASKIARRVAKLLASWYRVLLVKVINKQGNTCVDVPL